ncbi:MAG: GNAT family N-acetyltransferase [Chitinophagales bacterium]|nr:GNAT family N-acetyltransferase [Chitinophagales bacterium]
MTNKEKYIEYLNNSSIYNNTPIFLLPDFLNIVAEDWEVVLVEENSQLKAVLPYAIKGNLLTKRIYLPLLSFYQSFLLYDVNEETAIINQLFAQLPKTVKSYFKLLPQYHLVDLNALAYKQENYCTYIINKNIELYSIRKNHQRNIKKAINNNLVIEAAQNVNTAFDVIKQTFSRQNTTLDVDAEQFNQLVSWTRTTQRGEIWNCKDQNHQIHASVLLLKDATTTYYILGGYNDEFKNSGAKTFLLWTLIQQSIVKGKIFNFCGSTKKSIANYFEGFNATPTPISIWKKQLL